jgi:hypothetical protein
VNKRIHPILNILVVISMAIPWTAITPAFSAEEIPFQLTESTGIFRARLSLPNSASRARLDELGVTVLDEGDDWAVVLAAGDQLETLARLRFQPQNVDDLGALVQANAIEHVWLAESLQPTLERAIDLWG